ncbi:acyltransferase family protein [Dermatobacter hominis]|uniref:acyltransferase family protein n=1 Tax=Dermatobacter hominis TaxID=2884263 RepID=UPI001D0F7F0B|nr:acyltransferase [Dermatobacter hominis]UDY34638.1 acyltransferase [Dermatobacter hominis]
MTAAPDTAAPAGPIRVDAAPLHYEPALDGIRAVAVLAVMVFHFLGAEYFAGGLIGVDVFFVLSGFLITNLLLDERNRTGGVSLRGFYHRRVLRLFPAMYTLLALVAVAAIFIGAEYPSVWAELGAAALYSYQIFIGFFGFATEDSPRVLFHLWSLSVEEWFYFFWPFLLLLGLRTIRRQRALIVAASLWAAFWVAVRLSGEVVGVNWTVDDAFKGTGVSYAGEVLYRFSAMRFDQLLVGCLLALVVRRYAMVAGAAGTPRRRWLDAAAAIGALLLVAELLLAGRVGLFDPFGSVGFNLALAGIPFAVLWIHLNPQVGPARWLALPLAVWIGKRAYGLYLWHEVLNVLVPKPGGKAVLLVRTAVLIVASMGVAELSWRFIESPFLRRKTARYGDRHEAAPAGAPRT